MQEGSKRWSRRPEGRGRVIDDVVRCSQERLLESISIGRTQHGADSLTSALISVCSAERLAPSSLVRVTATLPMMGWMDSRSNEGY